MPAQPFLCMAKQEGVEKVFLQIGQLFELGLCTYSASCRYLFVFGLCSATVAFTFFLFVFRLCTATVADIYSLLGSMPRQLRIPICFRALYSESKEYLFSFPDSVQRQLGTPIRFRGSVQRKQGIPIFVSWLCTAEVRDAYFRFLALYGVSQGYLFVSGLCTASVRETYSFSGPVECPETTLDHCTVCSQSTVWKVKQQEALLGTVTIRCQPGKEVPDSKFRSFCFQKHRNQLLYVLKNFLLNKSGSVQK